MTTGSSSSRIIRSIIYIFSLYHTDLSSSSAFTTSSKAKCSQDAMPTTADSSGYEFDSCPIGSPSEGSDPTNGMQSPTFLLHFLSTERLDSSSQPRELLPCDVRTTAEALGVEFTNTLLAPGFSASNPILPPLITLNSRSCASADNLC